MKLKKSESLKILVSIAALLILTPLISTSLRFKYLYFILNILIITVGADAGLLSFFLRNKKHPPITNPITPDPDRIDDKPKCSSEKINFVGVKAHELMKSPSTPSIFFIGEINDTSQEEEGNVGQEQIGDLSGLELFQKSETFIGNFYKELKMQREESWNKLHRLSHKSF